MKKTITILIIVFCGEFLFAQNQFKYHAFGIRFGKFNYISDKWEIDDQYTTIDAGIVCTLKKVAIATKTTSEIYTIVRLNRQDTYTNKEVQCLSMDAIAENKENCKIKLMVFSSDNKQTVIEIFRKGKLTEYISNNVN